MTTLPSSNIVNLSDGRLRFSPQRYYEMGCDAATERYLVKIRQELVVAWCENVRYLVISFDCDPHDPLAQTLRQHRYLEGVRDTLKAHLGGYVMVKAPQGPSQTFSILICRSRLAFWWYRASFNKPYVC